MKAGPVVTDNGNFCLDAPFGQDRMQKPGELLRDIKMLTGVVEVGLFVDMAEAAYFGNDDGSISYKKKSGEGKDGVKFDVMKRFGEA